MTPLERRFCLVAGAGAGWGCGICAASRRGGIAAGFTGGWAGAAADCGTGLAGDGACGCGSGGGGEVIVPWQCGQGPVVGGNENGITILPLQWGQ